jgi:hypothetical protein
MSTLHAVVVGLLGLAPQEPEPARLFKLFEGVYVVETKAAAKALPETDGGAGTILAAAPGLVLVQVPANASLVRLRGEVAVTRDLPLSEAAMPRAAEAIDGLGLEPEGFAMVVDNRGASWILSLVMDARGALRSTSFVVSGARSRTALQEDEELRIFEPASGTWVARRLPPSVARKPTERPEGWWLNTRPLQFRGLTPAAFLLAGPELRTDVGDVATAPTMTTGAGTFELKDQTFRGFGAALELDFDLLRLSFAVAEGSMRGHGDFQESGGGLAFSEGDIEGDVRSVSVEAWWPAVRTEREAVHFGIGPTLGYVRLDEHLENIDAYFIRVDQDVTAHAALAGLRLGLDVLAHPLILRLGGSATRAVGDLDGGWLFEGQVGVHIEF